MVTALNALEEGAGPQKRTIFCRSRSTGWKCSPSFAHPAGKSLHDEVEQTGYAQPEPQLIRVEQLKEKLPRKWWCTI
jgi:hypothetical protein